jgi:hypothetical protein
MIKRMFSRLMTAALSRIQQKKRNTVHAFSSSTETACGSDDRKIILNADDYRFDLLAEEKVVVVRTSEEGSIFLEGAVATVLIPLIDGTRSKAALVSVFHVEEEAQAADLLVDSLLAHGLARYGKPARHEYTLGT